MDIDLELLANPKKIKKKKDNKPDYITEIHKIINVGKRRTLNSFL